MRCSPRPTASGGEGEGGREASAIGLSISANTWAAPGQKHSSCARSSFASATRCSTRSSRARESARSAFSLIAVGHQHAEAVAVGARQLGEHEAVEAVALAARGTEPRSHRRDLVGMNRDHRQAGVEQPLDQQPIRPLDRDQHHPERDQPRAQRLDPTLLMTVTAALDDPPATVDHAHRVLLAGPIDPREITLLHHHSSVRPILTVAGGEVPWWWSLTDGALMARLPVA